MKTDIYPPLRFKIIFLCLVLIMVAGIIDSNAQTTKTIGGGGANYPTLKAAFDAINAGSVTGAITLQLTGSTTETATAQLNASGNASANYTSIAIYPTGTGYSISGNLASPLIDLNGAGNITIDGRVNATGSTQDLIISNLNTSGTSNTATIRLINSAANNLFKYLTIKGGATGIYSGIILFASTSSGNGNSGNVIDNCNITGLDAVNRPYYGIYSYGTSGHENKNNTISNNNIFNFLSPTLGASYGIKVDVNSTDWIITSNSLYETTSFSPNGNHTFFGIKIGNSLGNNFIISSNSIGGSASNCSGSPWIVNGNFAYRFYCIHIDAGTTTASSIQNNTLKNFSFTGGSDIPWMGIDINSGSANIGTISGNTIGEISGTGSVTLSAPVASASASVTGGAVANNIVINNGGSGYTSPPTITFSGGGGSGATATVTISAGVVNSITVTSGGSLYSSAPTVQFNSSSSASTSYGIYIISTGTVVVSNNKIGSVSTTGTAFYSHGFFGISKQGTLGLTTINNNQVGSLSTSNSIQSSTSSTSSTAQNVYGIISTGTGTTTITSNTVANLYNAYAYPYATNGQVAGICTTGGVNSIQNNSVQDLVSTSPSNDPNANASVSGISQRSTLGGQNVSGNTIYALTSAYTGSRAVSVTGLYYSGGTTGTNAIAGNYIYGLALSATAPIGTPAILVGFRIYSGNTTISNNIINIGSGQTAGCSICGIYENGAAGNNNNLWFNSVYIGGTTSLSTANSYALFNNANTNIRDFRNNVFF